MKPRLKSEAGKTLYCFDSTQASTIARELLLNQAYQDKIVSLEATERNLEAEIDAREKAYLEQHQELYVQKHITLLKDQQITLLNKNILAYQRAHKQTKVGKVVYKTLTIALACTTVYLISKP